MVFSSSIFLFLFLPIVLLGCYLLPTIRLKNVWLLAVSLFFYAWGEHVFVLVMLSSIVVNYLFGLLLARYRSRNRLARCVASMAVAVNLGLLVVFKYANFIVDNINIVMQGWGFDRIVLEPIHLPIGISFFTFQAMSYVIDVYRGHVEVQRNPFHLGLYISMFPQLIAGPIVRYADIAKGIVQRTISAEKFEYGITRFVIGLSKKVILANRFGKTADTVFALPVFEMTGPTAWLGIVCYTLQIYFDFSGYSDMAIGLGYMFGFKFMENFRYPYSARSVREFWQRWHISLSTWFRDYVYIPLGGNRGSALRTLCNLMIVFLLCGLWHGASWVFMLWGAYHGLFLVLERVGLEKAIRKLPRPLQHIYLLFVVMIGWVFFRAETLDVAWGYIRCMMGCSVAGGVVMNAHMLLTPDLVILLVVGVIGVLPLSALGMTRVMAFVNRKEGVVHVVGRIGVSVLHVSVLMLLMVTCAMLLARGIYNPFIYFRF